MTGKTKRLLVAENLVLWTKLPAIMQCPLLGPKELARIPAVQIAFDKHKERIERLVNAEALNQFCGALITEFDGGARKPCTAKIAIACLGVDPSRKLAWCEPWNFSKPLSALIYHFRSVGYFCLKKAHITVAGMAQSSDNGVIGKQDDPSTVPAPYDDDELEELVIDFMEFRSKFLVLSASHVCDYLHRARAYCLKTKNPSISQFHADNEGFHFAGKNIFYNSFKPVARAMVEELMEDYLKISLHKEMGTEPWSVDMSALKDNLWDSTNGFSFVSHPDNCNAGVEDGNIFGLAFRCASNRATELLAALVQNDTDWPCTVRLFNGWVFLQQSYSKSMAKRESVVLHFLPKAVGQILVDWLVQGHPLHMMIETVMFQQECPPLLFWAKGGVVKPDDLSQDMSLKTAAYGLGAATGIRMFRQVQAFVIRAKLGAHESMQLGSAGPDTNEEENDGLAYEAELLHELESTEQLSQVGVALTLQAGHSVKTALKYYGLTQEDVVGVNESAMGAFLAASNKWHQFLGLGEDSLVSKDTDGDGDAVVVVSAKNFESLKVKAYPDKDHLKKPSCTVHPVLKTGPVPSSVITALRSIHSGKDIVLRANGGQAKAIFLASTSSSTPQHLLAALPTGTGKTEIWLAPLKAEREHGKPLCVLFLTPFVALGKDIVRRVEKAGLEAQYDVNNLGQLAAKVPFLLTTATLPPKQEATLGAIYGLQQLHVVRAPVQRANVRLEVHKVNGGQAEIEAHVQMLVRGVLDRGQSVMVFVTTRKAAVLWAETLKCGYYYSKDGQGDEIMDNHLCNFLNGRLKIIVGTTAFGFKQQEELGEMVQRLVLRLFCTMMDNHMLQKNPMKAFCSKMMLSAWIEMQSDKSRNKGKASASSSEDRISSTGPFDLSRPGPPVTPHQVGVKLFRSQLEISGMGTLLPAPQFNRSLGPKRPRFFTEANDMQEEDGTTASQVEEEFIPATSQASDFAVPPKHPVFPMGNRSGDTLFPRFISATAPEAVPSAATSKGVFQQLELGLQSKGKHQLQFLL
ncbi:hypothetical protein DFJ73DRAFT_757648 [Zopfochytrium polystomum]|nr:hypothetical protein DFJ73DRAFT_757648 [Zopfochytrium polystomum]